MMRRQVVALAALWVVALPASASAEVTVASGELAPGTTGLVSFAVSADRADASTTRVEVRLPVDRMFATVAAAALPGWQSQLVRSTSDQITAVTWTAQSPSNAIDPGTFTTFAVKLGPIPADVDRLTLSAIQTYSDGQTVESGGLPVTVRQEAATIAAASTAVEDVESAAAEDDDDAERVATGLVVGGLFLLLGVIVAAVLNRRRPVEAD